MILQLEAQIGPESFSSEARSIRAVNDTFLNINPFLSLDGQTLWFSKAFHPENVGGEGDKDIWKAIKRNGNWELASKASLDLNTEANELIIGVSNTGLLYVLRFSKDNSETISTLHAYKVQGSTLVKDHFLNIPQFEMMSEYFGFFVSPDESYILLSMEGEFSYGKEDLYVILKQGERWSEPIHLGGVINSVGFELSPFMTLDSKYLFFASNREGTLGGSDIFISKRLDNTWRNWSEPQNLGPKVNSAGFEVSLSLNERTKQAVFISDRGGQNGFIYQMRYTDLMTDAIEKESPHRSASGFLKMEKLPSMGIKLNLMNEDDEIVQSVMTDGKGYFNIDAFLPDRNYTIAVDDSIRAQLTEADIFMSNKMGDNMVFMNQNELGIFSFKVLSGPNVGGFENYEKLASKGKVVDKSTQISGRVASFGTLNEQVELNVLDDANNVIETIKTDDKGFFSFDTKAREKSYFLSVNSNGSGLVDVYEIYLTNTNQDEDIVVTKTDQQLFGFKSLANGQKSGMRRMPEEDFPMPLSILEEYNFNELDDENNLVGYLQIDRLPMMHTEIFLMDENDKVLMTATTDLKGKFEFANVIEVGNYSLQLAPEQERELSKAEIFLAKNPTDMVYYINEGENGVFAFKKLASNDAKTLYSLKSETERGKVVAEPTTLKGKFAYSKLPKSGVKLKLMDEAENILQVTDVKDNGEFTFENYTVNKNYFIAVENGEGLSDIYEIYISGENKNVLVNRTNKSVYSFKMLSSQAVELTKAFEEDGFLEHGEFIEQPRSEEYLEEGLIKEVYLGDKQAYFEFNIDVLIKSEYVSMSRIASKAKKGYGIVIRLSRESEEEDGKVELLSLSANQAEGVIKALIEDGVNADSIKVKSNGSDQIIIRIH